MLKKTRTYFLSKLTSRYDRIFIFPTRPGIYFIVIIFVLFLISLSYGHSLAFTTTFIFVSLVMTSAHFTNFNLSGVEVMTIKTPKEVFAGEDFKVMVTVRNISKKTRFDIEASLFAGDSCKKITLGREEVGIIEVTVKGISRGEYVGERLRFQSAFPFGLFRAWKYSKKDFHLFVFPSMIKNVSLPDVTFPDRKSGNESDYLEVGAEEFYGHDSYEEGMPLRSIDWQAYARGKGIFLKKFVANANGLILLKKEGDDLEESLSRLCSQVELATSMGVSFGISLENERGVFGSGHTFKREVLNRLSTYKKESKRVLL